MSEPEPTDEALMEAFRAGDSLALETLYVRHQSGLQSYLRTLVRDATLAQDLLQTTFVSIIRSIDRFERGAKVAPWLFTIARNAALDGLRHQSRAQTVATDSAPEKSVEASFPDAGLERLIRQALDALPVNQREAVVLHKIEGLTFEEISVALRISPTAARIRAHRGYQRLRELLKEVEAA